MKKAIRQHRWIGILIVVYTLGAASLAVGLTARHLWQDHKNLHTLVNVAIEAQKARNATTEKAKDGDD